ncbi:MAG: type II secretion system protein [Sedimentisphaerales bacterium]
MNRKNAFTLVELLVVISIIALLLGILMPALSKARKVAMGAVCMSQMKTYGTANQAYAMAYDGLFVPFSQYPTNLDWNTGKHGKWDERWCQNKMFRKLIAADRKTMMNAWEDPFVFPKELLCPAHKVGDPCSYLANFHAAGYDWDVIASYAMNTERWVGASVYDAPGWMPSDGLYRGYCVGKVTKPSSCMAFVESNYYMTHYDRANYILYWDQYGDVLMATPPNWAQVCYRHSEKCAASFFDGHAKLLPKRSVYNAKNKVNGYAPDDRKPEMLWDAGFPLVGNIGNGVR